MTFIKKENLTLTLAISALLSVPACQDSDTNSVQEEPKIESQNELPTLEEQQVNTLPRQVIKSAKEQHIEAYSNSKYTYDDAVLLATFWGKENTWDAKLKIGSLLIAANNQYIQQSLTSASNNQTIVVRKSPKEQQINAFYNSRYTYKDAVLLATFWGEEETWEAKLKIGDLLIKEKNTAIQDALTKAKKNEDAQREAYIQSTYNYDDAVLLAEFWGKSSPWEAKLKIGRLLINNERETIDQAIKHFLG
ncbi:MAG: hypothetical protein Q9M50_04355 [Methylococcales bacterium]|nr:hypothetical protein [Methylococcales bacterium]